MNKEDFLKYINQAVEALDEHDLNALFPENSQPDLNTVVQELIGLRGEVRKLAQSSLRMNNDVQTVIEQQKKILLETKEHLSVVQQPVIERSNTEDSDEYRELLKQIIEQDDIMGRTAEHFKTLPEVGFFNLNAYRQQVASWQKGYEISHQKWQKLMKSSGVYATGKVGEAFNPLYHEAIAIKTETGKKNNVILETETLGYIRGLKTVRRAKVVVNKVDS
jgi:molecular chaperone GrpE (heat shock protein)